MLSTRHRQIARRIVWTLFSAQSLGSTGFLAASTVTAIVGEALTGSQALATVPSAVYLIGTSLAALGWGYGMDRLGRRGGLTLGLLLGAAGAAIVTVSIAGRALAFFLAGLILMGIAQSAMQLARFAAAEVHPAEERGRAISNVVLGGTVSAIFWFLLSGPIETFMEGAGVPELAWPYIVSLVFFLAAMLVIFVLLRPDPRDVGREIANLPSAHGSPAAGNLPARPLSVIIRQPAAQVAMAAMIFGQAVMVMLMVITSLHMKNHAHSIGDISKVISGHVIGMFGFSVFSGRLSDRFGRGPVIVAGAATLVLACLTAPLSPDVLPLGVALFLLGLGWNFCFVGGSTLLADQLSPDERARTQGFNDLLIGLVSAAGSLGSGFVFAGVGYGGMGLVGAAAAVVPLALAVWWQVTRPSLATAH